MKLFSIYILCLQEVYTHWFRSILTMLGVILGVASVVTMSAIVKGLDKGMRENIIIYGESLGTGVATHLSQNKNFAGVVLETPFTSMIDAAKTFYPVSYTHLTLPTKA